MSDTQCPPASDAELRTVAMPADTNPYGDIFGGWLLSQMDVAGGTHAMARTGGRVATVGIEAMSFHPARLCRRPREQSLPDGVHRSDVDHRACGDLGAPYAIRSDI